MYGHFDVNGMNVMIFVMKDNGIENEMNRIEVEMNNHMTRMNQGKCNFSFQNQLKTPWKH